MGGGTRRKRASEERSESSEGGGAPSAPSAGVDLAAMRAMMTEVIAPLREDIGGMRAEMTGFRADLGALAGRVSVLEQQASAPSEPAAPPADGRPSEVPAPSAPRVPPVGTRGPAPTAPSAPSGFEALRIELVNLQDFARRFDQAMDGPECATYLTRLWGTLPAHFVASMLPLAEQLRRNARALCFVPCLHVRPGLTRDLRQSLLEHIRSQMDTGTFDRHGRRPRARWEPSPAQRPLSRLLAYGHRLTERLVERHPAFTTWKVQPAGTAVEVWLMQASARPVLALRADASHTTTFVVGNLGPLRKDVIQGVWTSIVSASA